MKTPIAQSAYLIDAFHPEIVSNAQTLCSGAFTDREKLDRLFLFVRDQIKFGFAPEFDFLKASQVLANGYGHCNNKAVLLTALCRAIGLSARMQHGLIDLRVLRGVIPAVVMMSMPKYVSHGWTEVQWNGDWVAIDNYVNDKAFYLGSRARLQAKGWEMGFSVTQESVSCEFVPGNAAIMHMPAVVKRQGSREDPIFYFNSPDNHNRQPALLEWMFRHFVGDLINRKIEKIREEGARILAQQQKAALAISQLPY
jgi:hypothetical protein